MRHMLDMIQTVIPARKVYGLGLQAFLVLIIENSYWYGLSGGTVRLGADLGRGVRAKQLDSPSKCKVTSKIKSIQVQTTIARVA